ncbi:MAG TPA: recombinase family protein, partial [Symbiobacteriaceae bacterium]|nr:recombinase family protein [Symbiobacteriaceae bacterium]
MSQKVLEQALDSFVASLDDTAIYVRWSTADQGDGTTLETQLEACKKLCAHHGWNVPDDRIFIDAGESGGNLLRPALDRLRAAVRSGAIKRVIVYRLDRL